MNVGKPTAQYRSASSHHSAESSSRNLFLSGRTGGNSATGAVLTVVTFGTQGGKAPVLTGPGPVLAAVAENGPTPYSHLMGSPPSTFSAAVSRTIEIATGRGDCGAPDTPSTGRHTFVLIAPSF